MTPVEQGRVMGFNANLAMRGRLVEADTKQADGKFESCMVLVEDAPQLNDPMQPMQAQRPVYNRISCLANAIKDPRAITRLTEKRTGRFHKVLYFDESSADAVVWRWFCEAQRQ